MATDNSDSNISSDDDQTPIEAAARRTGTDARSTDTKPGAEADSPGDKNTDTPGDPNQGTESR
jgi:photosystem I subunit 4